MEYSDRKKQKCFYLEWVKIQDTELSELQEAVRLNESGPESLKLVQKIMDHFQEYVEKRSRIAPEDASVNYAPPWFSSLENSNMFIGGCRPSSFVRFVYALCSLDIESNLDAFLRGAEIIIGNLGDLSANQMNSIDRLHRNTIREERKLQEGLAASEEEIVDSPVAELARNLNTEYGSSPKVEECLEKHRQGKAALLAEADQLRLETVKQLISILTPPQAVDFLATAKKLRLCIHEWGTRSDQKHYSA